MPALEMQMFTVTLNNPLELAAESNPAPRRVKTAVKMPTGYATAKDFLLEHPTFTQYFDTLTVSGEYLLRMDKDAAEKEAFYLRQTGVKLSLDLLSLSNLCPDLDVNPLYPAKQERTYKMVDDMLDKLFLYDADSVYTTWIRPAYGTEEWQQKPAVKELWAHITRRCHANGVQAVCQNRPLTLSPDDMFSLAGEVTGLALGLNTCGATLAGGDPAELAARYNVGHFLLSAPQTDRLGQVYNAYAPLWNSDSAAALRQLADTYATADSTVYFAATYEDWNQIYADYKAIF